MKNIFGIFRADIRRLTASVVSVVVIIGLCLVPCLYAWFNIMSNADPYGPASTSNIKVAVANEDKGSELLGLHFNIGDMVIEGISANNQMGWCFVDDRDAAMDGLYAGDYYAALIVPSDFTKDFLSILDGELRHPQVEYYENEKKNAIAPKITNKAKTAVQDQINSTIVEKVADVINTISSVFKAMGLDADDVADGLTRSTDNACQQLEDLTTMLTSLKTLADETQNLLDVTSLVIDDAGQVMVDASTIPHGIGNTADAFYDSTSTMNNNILDMLDRIDKNYAELANSILGWAGDPSSTESISQYLSAVRTDLDSIIYLADGSGFYSDIQSELSGIYTQLNTLEALTPTVGTSSADRDSFNSASAQLGSSLASLSGRLSNVSAGLSSPIDQISAVYAGLSTSSPDAYTINAQLASAASSLNNLGMLNCFAYDLGLIADMQSMLPDIDSAQADLLNYAQAIYDDLSTESSAFASAASYAADAQQNAAYAGAYAAGFSGGSEYYQQTLRMIDSITDSLNELDKIAPTVMQPQIKLAISANKALRDAFVKAGQAKIDQSLLDQISDIRETLREAALTLNTNINDRLYQSSQRIQDAMDSIQGTLLDGAESVTSLSGTLQKFSSAMGDAYMTLDDAISLSNSVHKYLLSISDDVQRMVNSEAFRQLMDILENNPDGLADYLVSPVDMRTVIVYEIADYGSAMSPYYIMLALFVGSLLTAAMIKPGIAHEEYRLAPPIQRYFGRLILFLCIGLFQALVTSLGCLFYVKIQCVDHFRFILACIIISFNFVMMNYSLLYALDNIGLAISVIIMVIQVAGSGGSYPIHVVPQIFQDLYPYMPFHYGMDLIRETIGGFYQGTYQRCALILLGMCLLFFVIGIVLYYPAHRLNEAIARSKAESGIM